MKNRKRKNQARDKNHSNDIDNKAANIFLVCLAKDMIRTEFKMFGKEANKFTVSWLIYEIQRLQSEPNLDMETLQKELDEVKKQKPYPPKFSNFGRRMWEKMDDFIFSKAHLNMLVKGIIAFGRFKNWDEFEKKYQNHEGKIWADELKGNYFHQLSNEQSMDLQYLCDKVIRKEYSELKFANPRTISPMKYPIFHDTRFCLRIILDEELEKTQKIPFYLGTKISHVNDRISYYSFRDRYSFFIVENLSNQIVGSVCLQGHQVIDYLNPVFSIPKTSKTIDKANSFLIHELRFSSNVVRDFILSNLQTIIVKLTISGAIEDYLSGKIEKNFYIYSNDEMGYFLADFGFEFVNEREDKLVLYKATIFDLFKNVIINQIDNP